MEHSPLTDAKTLELAMLYHDLVTGQKELGGVDHPLAEMIAADRMKYEELMEAANKHKEKLLKIIPDSHIISTGESPELNSLVEMFTDAAWLVGVRAYCYGYIANNRSSVAL